jgi:hypothetical protein
VVELAKMRLLHFTLDSCVMAVSITTAICITAAAADPANLPAAGPAPPPLEVSLQPLGEGRFALGKVILDKDQRLVSFPLLINQREGLVEYVVVTPQGKTHEAVWRTDAEPKHIHLAMLLLGVKPASTNFQPTDYFFRPPPGESVDVEVVWHNGSNEVRRPLNAFIITTNDMRVLSPGPWTYNGSFLQGGAFAAQRDGSIVALKVDPLALINNPRPGRDNENLYYVNTPALPPEGVTTEMIIRLLPASAPSDTEPAPGPPASRNGPAVPPNRNQAPGAIP